MREPSPASDDTNLTGTWVGDYSQHSRPSPITAELVHSGDRLTGSMWDGTPDRTSTVFEVAAEEGLPPGADEQIVARLREMFPDAPSSEIRYVTHLPPESALEGRVRGSTVTFLKTYRGDHFSGYKVGDRLVGHRVSGHAVQYSGRLSPDGMEIEGDGGSTRTPSPGPSGPKARSCSDGRRWNEDRSRARAFATKRTPGTPTSAASCRAA